MSDLPCALEHLASSADDLLKNERRSHVHEVFHPGRPGYLSHPGSAVGMLSGDGIDTGGPGCRAWLAGSESAPAEGASRIQRPRLRLPADALRCFPAAGHWQPG